MEKKTEDQMDPGFVWGGWGIGCRDLKCCQYHVEVCLGHVILSYTQFCKESRTKILAYPRLLYQSK